MRNYLLDFTHQKTMYIYASIENPKIEWETDHSKKRQIVSHSDFNYIENPLFFLKSSDPKPVPVNFNALPIVNEGAVKNTDKTFTCKNNQLKLENSKR